MIELILSLDRPWIFVGDFNDLLGLIEKVGGRMLPISAFDHLNFVLNRMGTLDVPHNGLIFTWRKYIQGSLDLEKLDRAFMHLDWFQQYQSTFVSTDHFSVSDHAPLVLNTKSGPTLACRPFRFQQAWVHNNESHKIIAPKWKKSSSVTYMFQLVKNLNCSNLNLNIGMLLSMVI